MSPARRVALETTLLLHGVPAGHGQRLAGELESICNRHGALPALIGVVRGVPTVGLSNEQLVDLLSSGRVEKANTSNLGVLMHRGMHGATTVATTMELASNAGIRVFATGGIGGVHRDYSTRLDISTDLAAFTRFPIAVVTSGVKSLLDVASTREALETLGIPVIGFRTDRFPAFYLRDGGEACDARFDDVSELASFVDRELARTNRGIVIANPIPEQDQIEARAFDEWLARAMREAESLGVRGRDVTPFILSALHRLSDGRTLQANLALVRSNVSLAAQLAANFR